MIVTPQMCQSQAWDLYTLHVRHSCQAVLQQTVAELAAMPIVERFHRGFRAVFTKSDIRILQ